LSIFVDIFLIVCAISPVNLSVIHRVANQEALHETETMCTRDRSVL